MIRAEAKAALWRMREVLAGLGAVLLGLYWAFFTGGGLLHWVGYVVALLGAAMLAAGWQRMRFRRGTGGPGVVQVVEGRITYFGPLSGGVADLESLTSVTLDPTAKPAHWLLAQPGQPPLAIPVNAEGADALFDAFAHLPGIQTGTMLRALEQGGSAPIVVWRKAPVRETVPRLH